MVIEIGLWIALVGLLASQVRIVGERRTRERVAIAQARLPRSYPISARERANDIEHARWMEKSRTIRRELEASLRRQRV